MQSARETLLVMMRSFISFHFHLKYSYRVSIHVDLQTALWQRKSYKIAVKIGTMKYVKVKER